MEETTIEKIDERNLGSKCHVDEHPIPNLIEVILFQFADEKYFGEIHLTQGKAEYYQVDDGE